MRYKIVISLVALIFSAGIFAQQQDTQHIRVVDTLTAKEKTSRNPIILKAELDSMIKMYNAHQAQELKQETDTPTNNFSGAYVFGGLIFIIALLGFAIWIFYMQRRKINKIVAELNEWLKTATSDNGHYTNTREKKGKPAAQTLEGRIGEMNAELHKLSKENESLNRVINEYNGIQHEYDALRYRIQKAYKVKNYPGYDKTKNETLAMQSVLDTENAVANYAYEKFLKPILTITDANKNSPARLNDTDREKLLDLLISLSLLYIEYLYLRVNDLSIGGRMVERIKNLTGSNAIDSSLLKKMNTEFGSRALVIKMALNKAGMQQLTYPVFDETNLNNQ
ncbi:MAG TPA: hypothetical protein VN451_11105 [Chitinophagaceae bacterium]|nr:hypothetical protein [Chitinophagaceae bacterium]